MIKLHVLNKRRIKEGWTEANCHDAYISIYSETFILKFLMYVWMYFMQYVHVNGFIHIHKVTVSNAFPREGKVNLILKKIKMFEVWLINTLNFYISFQLRKNLFKKRLTLHSTCDRTNMTACCTVCYMLAHVLLTQSFPLHWKNKGFQSLKLFVLVLS